jgi:hypothetical protein
MKILAEWWTVSLTDGKYQCMTYLKSRFCKPCWVKSIWKKLNPTKSAYGETSAKYVDCR